MTWALVVVGGGALLGAGASYAGSKKQSDAAKKAAGISQDQYGITRGDQLPYMGAGYGALSKLNTLLGINPNPNVPRLPAPTYAPPNPGYAPTPGGGVQPIMQMGPPASQPHTWNVPEAGMGNLPLNRILMIRAQNGDRQAQAMLQRMQP
jgi:hypothetical protein